MPQEANAISLDYDPAVNQDYWRRRPVAVVQRGIQIASAFGIWYVRGKLAGSQAATERTRSLAQAEQLRHILTRLGPAFVKIGQVPAMELSDHADPGAAGMHGCAANVRALAGSCGSRADGGLESSCRIFLTLEDRL